MNDFTPTTTEQMLMMHQFNAAFDHIAANTTDVAGLADFRRSWHDMCNNPGNHANHYFPYITCGAYKEVYSSWVDGWVIKFIADPFHARAEQDVYLTAPKYNAHYAFPDTFFINLALPLFSWFLDSDEAPSYEYSVTGDDEYYSEDGCLTFVTAIIQPLVTMHDELSLPANWSDSNFLPVTTPCGVTLDKYDVSDTGIESRHWLQSYVNVHGKAGFENLLNFINTFRLTDLHIRNIGYIVRSGREYPVIIDWMSSSPPHCQIPADDRQLFLPLGD